MDTPVIISVAPVCATDTQVQPQKVAQQAIDSVAAGASIVHLHCRDTQGRLTENTDALQQTIAQIHATCDAIIQASTGGVSNLNIEQRCRPLSCHGVTMASLNVGSVNLGDAVYINPPADVHWCATQVVEKHIMPEFEVFELGMIATIKRLQREIPFTKPLLYNIVLGHQGGAPANIATLCAMQQFIPHNALWGITHFARQDFTLLAAAIAMGVNEIRIGFEDSHYLSPTERTTENAALVTRLAGLIHSVGRKVASVQTTREILNMS